MADFPFNPDSRSVAITRETPRAFYGPKEPMTADASLPMFVVRGATQDLRLPMLTSEATLLPGNVTKQVQTEMSLPSIEAAATILSGSVYEGDASLPALTLEAGFGTFANIRLPKLTSSGMILGGQRLAAAVSLPRVTANGSAIGDGILTAAASLPAMTIDAQVNAGGAMSASITLKRIALAASGYSGTVVTGAVTLPVFTMDAEGHGEYIGQASIELPMLQMVATVPLDSGSVGTVTVFAMNAKNAALTNYENFDFNSMTRFNGVELLANDSGIFAITGNVDEGAIIEAYARMGVTDFGTNKHKRVEDAYIGYRAGGEMRLKVIVDEHHEYEYQVYPRNYDDLHGNRLKLGRGMKGVYWQAEIGNVDGSEMEVDSLQLVAQPLSRKV